MSYNKQEDMFEIKESKGKDLWLCTCGQSKNYPYCDGAHKNLNNGSAPLRLRLQDDYSILVKAMTKNTDDLKK